jgi:predicted enzyme related to lactoylglutathione lyase
MNYLHTITHIEIPAPDLQKAIDFYSKVFDWGIEIVTIDHYAFFTIGNTGSGGGFDASLMPAPEKTGPQLTIDVENMEAAMKKIKENGGNIVMDKTEIPGGHGFYCIFTDPNHNHLQLHSR